MNNTGNISQSGCIGRLMGAALLAGGIALLIFNEWNHHDAMQFYSQAREAMVELTDTTTIDPANNGKLVTYSAWATPGQAVVDPLYGIASNGMLIRRDVQYYQWCEQSETKRETVYRDGKKDFTYRTVYSYYKSWQYSPVNSNEFNNPKGHENHVVTEVPINREYSRDARLGPYRMSHALMDSILPDVTLPIDTTAAAFKRGNATVTANGAVPWTLLHKQLYPRPYTSDILYYGTGTLEAPHIGDVRVMIEASSPCRLWVAAKADEDVLQPYKSPGLHDITHVSQAPINVEEQIKDQLQGNVMLEWTLRVIGWILVCCGACFVLDILYGLLRATGVLVRVPAMGERTLGWAVGTFITLGVIAAMLCALSPRIGVPLLALLIGATIVVGHYNRE